MTVPDYSAAAIRVGLSTAIKRAQEVADPPVKLTGNDLIGATADALDQLLGALETVVHVAGPTIEGGVLCTSCGTVLQDLYGQHVALDAETDWDLRHDHGWGEGTRVWELWRWGAPTVNPHALGALPDGQDPDPAQLERWCTTPPEESNARTT